MRWVGHLLGAVLLAVGAMAAEEPVAAAINRLGAAKYADRQAAEAELVKRAQSGHEAVLRQCTDSYRQSDDPEVRLRLKSVIEQMVEQYLFKAPRGFLGVQINNVFVGEGGKMVINGTEVPPRSIWVGQVVEGSGAARAGLLANDVITAVNGQPWAGEGPSGFTRHIQAKKPGTVVKLQVLRGNQTNEVTATLGELPPAERERVYDAQRWKEFFEEWWQQHLGEDLPLEQ